MHNDDGVVAVALDLLGRLAVQVPNRTAATDSLSCVEGVSGVASGLGLLGHVVEERDRVAKVGDGGTGDGDGDCFELSAGFYAPELFRAGSFS